MIEYLPLKRGSSRDPKYARSGAITNTHKKHTSNPPRKRNTYAFEAFSISDRPYINRNREIYFCSSLSDGNERMRMRERELDMFIAAEISFLRMQMRCFAWAMLVRSSSRALDRLNAK